MKKNISINAIIAICFISCVFMFITSCSQKDGIQTIPSNNKSPTEDSIDNHTESPPESTETEQTIETNNESLNLGKPSTGDLPGNSMSNLMNAGMFATDGEWDYIVLWKSVDSDTGLYKNNIDGKKCMQLTDYGVKFINLVEDWIYYSDDGGIYRLKKDGSIKEQIFNGKCYGMIIIGETIYFINGSDEHKMYRVDTNGDNLRVLIDAKSYDIQYYDGYLYFLNFTDKQYILNRANINNLIKSEKLAENVFEYIINNNCLYYLKRDEWRLYKKNAGESESRIINNNIDTAYFIENDKIYFTMATGEDESIYTMDLDGKNITEFYNGRKNSYPVGDIYGVVRDTVYYREASDAGELVRINHDGSITMVDQIINASDKIGSQ